MNPHKLGKNQISLKCSNCKKIGHNKKGCKVVIGDRRGVDTSGAGPTVGGSGGRKRGASVTAIAT